MKRLNLGYFKLLNYDIKIMIISTIFISLPQGFLFVDFPIYLNIVGYSPLLIGLLFTISTFIGSFLVLFIATISDLKGRKNFVILGYLLFDLSFLILAITYDLILIITVAVLDGIAFASISSSFITWFTEKTNSEDRNYAFSFMNFIEGVFSSIGMVIGGLPPIIAVLTNISIIDSYKLMYFINFLFSLPSLFLIYRVKESYRIPKEVEILPRESFKFVMKLSILGLIGLGAGIIIQLFPLWFYLKFGTNVDVLGPIFAISTFLTGIASFFIPMIVKRFGTINIIIFPQLLSIIILIAIPISFSYLFAGVLYIFRNVLMNMSNPIFNSFIMTIIPEEERARGSAIIQLFDSIPRSIGPTIGGYFFNMGMLDLPFYITAILYTASIILFYMVFKPIFLKRI
jgi:Major Facilitator Superfamily.